jgi:hemolysin type calcium-binding protein
VSIRGSLRLGGAALALAGLMALIVLGSAPTHAGKRPPERAVKCTYSPDANSLSVRLRHIKIELPPGFPARLERLLRELLDFSFSSAAIDVRIGEITILDGDTGVPIRCAGGTPTVDNTDTVLVRKGKRVGSGELFLDLRYGLLQPGATDEGDGGSEIEFDVDLDGGEVVTRMTRGVDPVTVGESSGRIAVNLNAGESAADVDLLVGQSDDLQVVGGGSGDRLLADDGPPFTGSPALFLAEGGQGDDLLEGGSGPDGLFGGGGSDRINAGAGPDFMLVRGRATDHIDCGPGHDTVLIFSRARQDLRDCEDKLSRKEFFEELEKPRSAKGAGIVIAGKLDTLGSKIAAPPLRRWASTIGKR